MFISDFRNIDNRLKIVLIICAYSELRCLPIPQTTANVANLQGWVSYLILSLILSILKIQSPSLIREFEQIERLTTQLNIAEQDNAELKSTISHMERIMELERQDRLDTEQKTLELLGDVKKKWTRAEEERMECVKTELGQLKS